MNAGRYRKIKGTTIEVPDWEYLPAFDEFSPEKRERNKVLIRALRQRHFGSGSSAKTNAGSDK